MCVRVRASCVACPFCIITHTHTHIKPRNDDDETVKVSASDKKVHHFFGVSECECLRVPEDDRNYWSAVLSEPVRRRRRLSSRFRCQGPGFSLSYGRNRLKKKVTHISLPQTHARANVLDWQVSATIASIYTHTNTNTHTPVRTISVCCVRFSDDHH